MDSAMLSLTCAGLGAAEEDDDGSAVGYVKGKRCLVDGVILRLKTAVKTDPKLTALLKDGTCTKASRARDLFLALATCNTIVSIVEDTVNPAAKLVEYQGESPDKQALVYAAVAYGHKLVECTSGHIVVDVFGTRQRMYKPWKTFASGKYGDDVDVSIVI
ncbi:phospholipid-transporting ATPase 1-like [Hordeum vulgare]|nr:phospholipid-transporting ATPase 1-like [Hordeum vulgare]